MASLPSERIAATSRVLVILVLYCTKAEDSPAYRELDAAMQRTPAMAKRLTWMICDNSPYLQPPPPAFAGLYVQDLMNAGLAKRYNLALQRASAEGYDWLLLLDQDTQLSEGYLSEILLLSTTLQDSKNIVAIVPKLVQRDQMLSPHLPLTFYWHKPEPIGLAHAGVLAPRVQAFNSGALLRTSALRAIGGFPEHFWLDYLDHATFYRLQAAGGKIFLMQAKLEHALSTNPVVRAREASVGQREANILKASRDYYWFYGSFGERFEFLRQLIRILGGALRHKEIPRFRELVRTVCSR